MPHLLEMTAVGRVYDAPQMSISAQGEAACNFTLTVEIGGEKGPTTLYLHARITGNAATKHWQNLQPGDEIAIVGRPFTETRSDAEGNTFPQQGIVSQYIRYSQVVFNRMQ